MHENHIHTHHTGAFAPVNKFANQLSSALRGFLKDTMDTTSNELGPFELFRDFLADFTKCFLGNQLESIVRFLSMIAKFSVDLPSFDESMFRVSRKRLVGCMSVMLSTVLTCSPSSWSSGQECTIDDGYVDWNAPGSRSGMSVLSGV